MELKAFFLFFTVYSSIEAFTIEHGPTQFNDNDGLAVIAQNDDCQCKNGRCVKDNRGKTKCNCKHGYALQDEFTCEPCDCGSKGSCMFVGLSKPTGGFSYVKKCICDQGSAEKDGICVDCHCGENGKCEFEDGEKVCYCTEGYAEKDGVCTIENCNKGKCKGTDCNCCPGYGIKRNFRRGDSCKKCNCGQNFSCSFNSRSRKTCNCPAGYSEKRGICTERLDI